MTGYTRQWECWICDEGQESIAYPKVHVCEKCVRPLAATLCKQTIGISIDSEGVDRDHWEQKAWDYAEILFRRRPTNVHRAA